jgi:hypothetical protein
LALLINRTQKWGFIHIPKTGGTSVTNILEKIEGTERITGHDSLRVIDYEDLFIFTFVRNPFTRLISAFMHGVRSELYPSNFSQFLTKANIHDLWLLQQNYYINSGKTENKKVSYIGRYENFENDLKEVLKKLNIQVDKIPHINHNPIYDKHPNLKQESYYKQFYTEEWMKDWVRERYRDDFKQFDYELEI